MNSELSDRILAQLDGRPEAMLAIEIGVAIGAAVEDVRKELGLLVRRNLVFRHHCDNATLRYSSHKIGTQRARAASPSAGAQAAMTGLSHVVCDPDVLRRLSSLQVIGRHVSAHLSSALAEAEIALKKLNVEAHL